MSARKAPGPAPLQLTKPQMATARRLWADRVPMGAIGQAVSVSKDTIARLAKRHPKQFPPRDVARKAVAPPAKPKRQRFQPDANDRAKIARLWAAMTPAVEIARTFGIKKSQLHSFVSAHRDLCPPRRHRDAPQPVPIKAPAAKPEATPLVHAAGAYLPLPGTAPVSLVDVTGCRWPVGEDDRGIANLFCDAAPETRPDGRGGFARSSWCACHARMAEGEGTRRERRAIDDAKRRRAA